MTGSERPTSLVPHASRVGLLAVLALLSGVLAGTAVNAAGSAARVDPTTKTGSVVVRGAVPEAVPAPRPFVATVQASARNGAFEDVLTSPLVTLSALSLVALTAVLTAVPSTRWTGPGRTRSSRRDRAPPARALVLT